MAEANFFKKTEEIYKKTGAETDVVGEIKKELEELKKDRSADAHIAKIKFSDLTSDKRLIPIIGDLLQREQDLTEDEIKTLETKIVAEEKNPNCVEALYEFFGLLLNRALSRAARKNLAKRKMFKESAGQKEINL